MRWARAYLRVGEHWTWRAAGGTEKVREVYLTDLTAITPQRHYALFRRRYVANLEHLRARARYQ
jgi:hypothetical protein